MSIKGMDINSSQENMSMTTAKASGIQFAIVKMGGYNVTPMYVAPFYHAQVDRCVSAAMPKGHMWVTGQGDATAQADYFTDNLYRFDKSNDILALDNEAINSNGELWGDTKCATFINRVISRLSITPSQIYLYASASVSRAHSWPATIATKCRYWVASWGPDDGSRTAPDIGSGWPSWDIQQYTTKGNIGGYQVDLDYSPRSISEIFGVGSGSTTEGTLVLSAEDRTMIQTSIDNALTGILDNVRVGVWQHQIKSAVDGGSHYIQTLANWAQRDTGKSLAVLSGDDPEFILVKETSTPTVYALNPQKGSKHALTAGQLTVVLNCGLSYKTVADGLLSAFTST